MPPVPVMVLRMGRDLGSWVGGGDAQRAAAVASGIWSTTTVGCTAGE
jgi:hypothetical protein